MHRHSQLIDIAIAAILAASGVWLGWLVDAPAEYYLVSLALPLPLAWRRTYPQACAAAVLVLALVQWITTADTLGAMPVDLAVLIAVHACCGYGPLWSGYAALGCGLIGAALGGWSWPMTPAVGWVHLLTGGTLACLVLIAWTTGLLHRARRGRTLALAERARLLESQREQHEQLAVLAERNRIARDMHDIVAHSLAVVIAQADGGRYAAGSSPEAAAAALDVIAGQARQALAETRHALGLLRTPGERPVGDLAALVEQARASGLDVRLVTELPDSLADPALALTVYRVVQEGLTNVLKHAGAAAGATVSVSQVGGRLEIEVADDGGTGANPAPSVAGGFGVLGLRERAGAYGGDATLRPVDGGGHLLHAWIPVP